MDLSISQAGLDLSPSVEGATLGKGDHLLNEWLNSLGLGPSGLDLAVLEEPGCEISKHRPTMFAGSIQLLCHEFDYA